MPTCSLAGRGAHLRAAQWRRVAVYLGTTLVDKHIRSVFGTTQINAADLRALPCPPRDVLTELGAWAARQPSWPEAGATEDRLAALTRKRATDPA